MAEYDKIADRYSEIIGKSPGSKYLWDYGFLKILGKLNGKSVLDLACGDGFITRQAVYLGAASSVGVDVSEGMIKIAKQKEALNPLGIKYLVGKVGELKKIGEFDVVTAGFLLHYSQDKEELLRMCKDVYKNLKKGGRFISINRSPFTPLNKNAKYGSICESIGEFKEGAGMKVTLYGNGGDVNCSFVNYHWSKETYECALKEAGFENIKWVPLEVSKEGIKEMGKDFWNEWYQNPYLIIVEASK